MKRLQLLLLTLLLPLFIIGQDIRVDRYEVNVGANGTTQAITDIGDVNSAFVRLVGSSIKGSSGPTGSTGNTNPNVLGLAAQLTATNEVTFYRELSTEVKVMFEVWSYVGVASGDNEFVVRQRDNVTLTNGNSSVTEAITGMTDADSSVPIYQGWTSAESSNSDYEAIALACHIDDSDNVSFSRGNTGGGSDITAYYTIVEFTGAAWNVGTAYSNAHDNANIAGILVSMNTDSDGVGGSTFDVTDWSTAMILEITAGGDSGGETGLADAQLIASEGDATTNVRIHQGDDNAAQDDDAYVYVIQNDDLVVNRGENANLTEGNGSYGTNLTVSGVNSGSALTELALEWSVSTTGTGTAWARGALSAQLTAYNTIQHWIHRSGNNVFAAYGVVDMTALDYVAPAPSTGQIKVWTGSAWEAKPLKWWTGSAWEIKPLKYWNGSSWVETPY